jgi:hypothetical protein
LPLVVHHARVWMEERASGMSLVFPARAAAATAMASAIVALHGRASLHLLPVLTH